MSNVPRILAIGRRTLVVAFWIVVAMFTMTLVLVACESAAPAGIVNSL